MQEGSVKESPAEEISGEYEVLVGDVDPRPSRHQVATAGFAAQRALRGALQNAPVSGEPVAHPKLATVLTEFEVTF